MEVFSIVVECPTTGRATRTGHEVADIAGFNFVGLLPETVQCEHCSESHTWSQKDAWPVARQNASRVRLPAAWTPNLRSNSTAD
jgi:hypothetical protein